MNTILDFYNSTLLNGGASFNPITNELNPVGGYFVSLLQYERKVALNDLTVDVIEGYINNNVDALAVNNMFLGSWTNKDVVCLDISLQIFDKRIAIERAYKHNQSAVYDANNDVIINLPTPQRSGTETQRKAYITSVVDKLCK